MRPKRAGFGRAVGFLKTDYPRAADAFTEGQLVGCESFTAGAVDAGTDVWKRSDGARYVCQSGRADCEMTYAQLDRRHAARVDPGAVAGPVLVIGGGRDRVVPAAIARARRYRAAKYVELPQSDHLTLFGAALPQAMTHIDRWLDDHALSPASAAATRRSDARHQAPSRRQTPPSG